MKHKLYTLLLIFCIHFYSCKNDELIPHNFTVTNIASTNSYLGFLISDESNFNFGKVLIYNSLTGKYFQLQFENKNLVVQEILDLVAYKENLYSIIRFKEKGNTHTNIFQLLKINSSNNDVQVLFAHSSDTIVKNMLEIKVFNDNLFLHNKFKNEIYSINSDETQINLIYKQPHEIDSFFIKNSILFLLSNNLLIIQDLGKIEAHQYDELSNKVENYIEDVSLIFTPIKNGVLIKVGDKLIGYNTQRRNIEFEWKNIRFIQQLASNKHYFIIKDNKLLEYSEDFSLLKEDTNINALTFLNDKYFYNLIIGKSLELSVSVRETSNTSNEYIFPMYSSVYQYLDVPTRQYKWAYKVFGDDIVFFNGKNLIYYQNGQFSQINDTNNLVTLQNELISYSIESNKITIFSNPFSSKSKIGEIIF